MQLRRRPLSPVPVSEATHEPQPIDPDAHPSRRVVTIDVTAHSPLPPQRVLEAARDFSERRADVWPNVRRRHLKVHESGESFADVTEGTWVVGLFWERNRYDWSTPGTVRATVIDSSIFEPGSTWELRATARGEREPGADGPQPWLPQKPEGQDRQRRPPHRRHLGLALVSQERSRRCREAD